MPNKFFDYIHAGVPQLCVNYPVYREINDQYTVAVMIDDCATVPPGGVGSMVRAQADFG